MQFAISSPEEIQQEAHIRIISKNLYSDGRQPVAYGVLDRRMVTFQKCPIRIPFGITLINFVFHIFKRVYVKRMVSVQRVIRDSMTALVILDTWIWHYQCSMLVIFDRLFKSFNLYARQV